LPLCHINFLFIISPFFTNLICMVIMVVIVIMKVIMILRAIVIVIIIALMNDWPV